MGIPHARCAVIGGIVCSAVLVVLAVAAEPERAPGRLRWNEVQFKAAHNSVDLAEPIPRQLDWDPAVPHDGGCRGVELDIVMDPSRTATGDDWVFGVQHGGAFKPSSPRLDECLRLVRGWSTAHPGHDPIAVHIDIKPEATLGDDAAFIEKIDALLDRELGADRLFSPRDLRGKHGSLLAAVEAQGWPEVESLREKFIVVFSGGDLDGPVGRRRRAYLEKGGIAFVDLDQRAAGASGRDECDIRNPYYNSCDAGPGGTPSDCGIAAFLGKNAPIGGRKIVASCCNLLHNNTKTIRRR